MFDPLYVAHAALGRPHNRIDWVPIIIIIISIDCEPPRITNRKSYW